MQAAHILLIPLWQVCTHYKDTGVGIPFVLWGFCLFAWFLFVCLFSWKELYFLWVRIVVKTFFLLSFFQDIENKGHNYSQFLWIELPLPYRKHLPQLMSSRLHIEKRHYAAISGRALKISERLHQSVCHWDVKRVYCEGATYLLLTQYMNQGECNTQQVHITRKPIHITLATQG